jgi:lipid-A-disaccharide synthase
MRYFFSTGEASGELNATLLAAEIATVDADARFEGIGAERMRAHGFTMWRDHTGWASMGPLAAIPRIPKLLATMWQTALHIASSQPDLVVLVDFGAFNMRLAKTLRERLGYRGAIMYYFPPAAWLDKEGVARAVSGWTVPVVAFERHYEFYKRNRFPVMYFGHPMRRHYVPRAPRSAPPAGGGTVALLPGSRGTELQYHLPALLGALRLLRAQRPRLHAVISAANAPAERQIQRAIRRAKLENVRVVRGSAAALEDVDAAFVASGTAVLESALLGVPTVALYIIAPILVRHARKVYSGAYITLPNLLLGREAVPELLQDDATPEHLASAMENVLRDPGPQYEAFDAVRAALGPESALQDCAKFAFALAKAASR